MTKILSKLGISVMSVFGATLVLWSLTVLLTEATAQEYPTKPIRILVANAPGAGADVIARLIGARLAEALGRQILIDNRPGASGRIAAEAAARSTPDGYTLLMVTSQHAIVSGMYENLNYDLVKDFSPISLLGTTPFILVVTPSLQANSIKELMTLAKSRPGVLQYGSPGSGMAGHLSGEIFKFMTGTDILHVPYKGASQAVTGTLAGEVNMTFQAIPAVLPMIKSGKLRALGVTSARRTPLVPDVPAISESVPGYEYSGWYSLVAPTKTPPGIISKLHTEVVKALNDSVVRERMIGLGVDLIGSTPEEFTKYLQVELVKMKEAVKLSGARPEN